MAGCHLRELLALALSAALLVPASARADEGAGGAHRYRPDWPVPPPAPPPRILWHAGMETGDLSEWDEKVNTDSADSVAVTAARAGIPPKGGLWVLEQSVTGMVGGTRMARYPEVEALAQAGITFYVTWWDYFPTKITFDPADLFTNFHILSRDADGGLHPIWGVFFHPTDFSLILGWNANGMAPAEGPHAGESGKRAYFSTRPVPVAQWVFFEVMITPMADFTGALKIWLDGELLFDLANVKTRFPDVGVGGFMWLNHDAYGSRLTPTPATHYIDDVTFALDRLPRRR